MDKYLSMSPPLAHVGNTLGAFFTGTAAGVNVGGGDECGCLTPLYSLTPLKI